MPITRQSHQQRCPLLHALSSFLCLSASLARMRNWFSLKSYYWNCSLDNKVKNNTRDPRCSRQWHLPCSLALRTRSRRWLAKYRRKLVRQSSGQNCRWRPQPDDMKTTHIASRVIITTYCLYGRSQIQIPPGDSLSWLSSVSSDQNGNNIRPVHNYCLPYSFQFTTRYHSMSYIKLPKPSKN